MAVFDPVSMMLTNSADTERISVTRISPNLLPLLGIQPIAGRSFSEDEANERRRVALISERFWKTRLIRSDSYSSYPNKRSMDHDCRDRASRQTF